MAVAVKNTTEVRTASLFDRAPIASLIGAAYVIACLGVLGKALPYIWWEVFGFDESSMMFSILLLMVLTVAAAGLGFIGLRVLGARAPVGTRAGVFVAVVGILIILLLTRWASLWIEHWVFYGHRFEWFGPGSGVTVGACLTGAIGLVLLGVGAFYFQDRRFERYLVQIEEQGWFTATVFKGQQGIKVRRGTILGILLIVGAGIYTLLNRGTLQRGPADWEIDVPFTARMLITNETIGDAAPALKKRLPEQAWQDDAKNPLKQPVWISRYELRDVNDELSQFVRVRNKGASTTLKDKEVIHESEFKAAVEKTKEENPDLSPALVPVATPLTAAVGDEVSNYVRIRDPGDSSFAKDTIVSKKDLDAEVTKLRGLTAEAPPSDQPAAATGKTLPKAVPLVLGTGTEIYRSLTLLPSVQYTLPLLLIAVATWFSWRAVNYPMFADFLIATEAELNKVSWASRRKLVQDTIVVLITVFLMAVFLFAMDQAWSHLLSWKQIGVIQINRDQTEKKTIENRPW
jgi:preprotein translocase SecE subunit